LSSAGVSPGVETALVYITTACVGIILTGYAANPLCNLVGFLYPVYASFKALKTRETEDDTQWLTYWVVYGCLQVLESFLGFIIRRMPIYSIVKLLFLMWCFLPPTKGASFIFRVVILPILNKYEANIDADVEEVEAFVEGALQNDEVKSELTVSVNENEHQLGQDGSSPHHVAVALSSVATSSTGHTTKLSPTSVPIASSLSGSSPSSASAAVASPVRSDQA